MTAAKLIELLASHIEAHGNVGVEFIHYDDRRDRYDDDRRDWHEPICRCWFDAENGYIIVGPE